MVDTVKAKFRISSIAIAVWFAKIRRVPVTDLHDQFVKIDRQIIDLLAERIELYQEAMEDEEEAPNVEGLSGTQAEWEEIADEKGWNLTSMAKICRGIVELCKSGGE